MKGFWLILLIVAVTAVAKGYSAGCCCCKGCCKGQLKECKTDEEKKGCRCATWTTFGKGGSSRSTTTCENPYAGITNPSEGLGCVDRIFGCYQYAINGYCFNYIYGRFLQNYCCYSCRVMLLRQISKATSSGYGTSGYGTTGYGTSGLGTSGVGMSRYGTSGISTSGYGTRGYGTSGVGTRGYGTSGYGNNYSPMIYPAYKYRSMLNKAMNNKKK